MDLGDRISNWIMRTLLLCMLLVVFWFIVAPIFADINITINNSDLAAWSGPFGAFAAISIALWNNCQTNKRFFRQLRAEMRLDKQADKRQQEEWNNRKIQDKQDRNLIRRSIRKNMIIELEQCKGVAQTHLKQVEAFKDITDYALTPFIPFRPVFESIGSNYHLLNNEMIKAIANSEGRYRNFNHRCEKFYKLLIGANADEHELYYDLYIVSLNDFISACDVYIQVLQKCNHGASPQTPHSA